MRVVIVGVGGVGTRLARELPMYLSRKHPGAEVVLVDGDAFEPKNADRQDFDVEKYVGVNKAAAWAHEVQKKYPELRVSHLDEYLNKDNIGQVLTEGTVALCAVDNHASRLLMSDRVSQLRDGVLISGGNDFDAGNVQVHARKDGEDLCPPITFLHPEIGDPNDPRHGKHPQELSCEELAAAGAPQLQFANGKVAQEMLDLFWNWSEGRLPYSEVYFDLKRGTQRPVMRKERKDAEAAEPTSAELAAGSGDARAAS